MSKENINDDVMMMGNGNFIKELNDYVLCRRDNGEVTTRSEALMAETLRRLTVMGDELKVQRTLGSGYTAFSINLNDLVPAYPHHHMIQVVLASVSRMLSLAGVYTEDHMMRILEDIGALRCFQDPVYLSGCLRILDMILEIDTFGSVKLVFQSKTTPPAVTFNPNGGMHPGMNMNVFGTPPFHHMGGLSDVFAERPYGNASAAGPVVTYNIAQLFEAKQTDEDTPAKLIVVRELADIHYPVNAASPQEILNSLLAQYGNNRYLLETLEKVELGKVTAQVDIFHRGTAPVLRVIPKPYQY